ncbi:MAG: secretion protein HlyD, partial [Acidimicrobiales bacterium]|nr:secretion protein HlyD [Acidimicrobiales bacterium]
MASHRTTATRRLLLGLAAVALLLGGGVAVAASTSTTPRSGHRTATVGRHPVAHELTGVGTIEPVAQASVAFPVAGTVSAVSVRVGDLVSTGQALAGLDTTALQARRLQAQAALDAARLKLARALAGQSVSGAASGAASGSGSGAGGTGTATATAT